MGCSLTVGIQATCIDTKQIGGLRKTMYIGNTDDVESFSVDGSGYVTAINLYIGKTLYEFISKKLSNSAGFDVQVGAGASVVTHSTAMKLFISTPEQYATLEELSTSEIFVIAEDNNGNWKLYGWKNGLIVEGLTESSGITFNDDTTLNVRFVGGELTLPKFILNTDYYVTRDLIRSYLVAAEEPEPEIPDVPSNALLNDDGSTPLLNDDGTTILLI